MNKLNSLIIEGNIVKYPLIKQTPKGTLLALFAIAHNRSYRKDGEFMQETSFFDVEAWGSIAKIVEEKARKGQAVRVVGRIKQERWLGADGKNHSKFKIIAEHIEFLKMKSTENKDDKE